VSNDQVTNPREWDDLQVIPLQQSASTATWLPMPADVRHVPARSRSIPWPNGLKMSRDRGKMRGW
jgi:hypothetical protein